MTQEKKRTKLAGRITKRLKWGVAGLGSFAENSFLPAFSLLKRSKITAVFSKDALRAKTIAQKFSIAGVFSNFDDFLKSDFDVLYVSSVTADHHQQVIKAAEAGKHILCESPMAINSLQAKEMIEACEKAGVFLSVNYQNRFHPLVIKSKELIDKQLLGKIVSISCSFNTHIPPGDNFRYNKELSGGGVVRDLVPHLIDILNYFGGNIEEIQGYMDKVIYQTPVEDFMTAVVKFEKSGYGSLLASFNTKKAFNRIEILGHNGALSLENLIGKKGVPGKLMIDLHGEARKSFRKRSNKLLNLLRSVQKSLFRNEQPEITGYDGLMNMKLIELLEKNVIKK